MMFVIHIRETFNSLPSFKGSNAAAQHRPRGLNGRSTQIRMDQRSINAMPLKYLGCYAVFASELGRWTSWWERIWLNSRRASTWNLIFLSVSSRNLAGPRVDIHHDLRHYHHGSIDVGNQHERHHKRRRNVFHDFTISRTRIWRQHRTDFLVS